MLLAVTESRHVDNSTDWAKSEPIMMLIILNNQNAKYVRKRWFNYYFDMFVDRLCDHILSSYKVNYSMLVVH